MDGKEWREKNKTDSWGNESDSYVGIRSQEELDEVPEDFKGNLWIEFGTEEKRAILDKELPATICVFGGSVMEIRKPNRVRAWEESIVYAWNKDKVKRFDDAKVYDLEEIKNGYSN